MDSAIKAANEKKYYLTQEWAERNLDLRQQMAIMDYNEEIYYAQEEKAMEIARKLLAEGMSAEFVQKITGLDIAIIEGLSG